jgi:hypothetical protein
VIDSELAVHSQSDRGFRTGEGGERGAGRRGLLASNLARTFRFKDPNAGLAPERRVWPDIGATGLAEELGVRVQGTGG